MRDVYLSTLVCPKELYNLLCGIYDTVAVAARPSHVVYVFIFLLFLLMFYATGEFDCVLACATWL